MCVLVSFFMFHTWVWYRVACFKNSTTSSHPVALAWREQQTCFCQCNTASKCLASSFIRLYEWNVTECINCLVIILYLQIPINSPLQWASVRHNYTWSFQPQLTAKSPILLSHHSPQDWKTHSRSSKWAIINTGDDQFCYVFNTRNCSSLKKKKEDFVELYINLPFGKPL